MDSALIILEARKWLGTPFGHRGRVLGKSCDCVGLLFGVARGLGLPNQAMLNYAANPHPREMYEELCRQMVPTPLRAADLGDVYHMAWGRYPQHVAIITDVGIIHSWKGVGRVVEHPLDDIWRGRIRGAYRFRE
jgi:NlpC/P60 family putative phage cell wall peptidase